MEAEQRETEADMQEEEREEDEEDVIEIQNEEEDDENIHQSHDIPALPNLALEAIERLRDNPPLDEDSLSDDFQPTRKKRKQNQKKDMSTSDENEVRHIDGHAPRYHNDVFIGSDLLYMF